ncbi:hypothetical protein [uncultured Rhodoblastus sp.]|uniref:hypothetical protein n=1 Tax=uncultured Rhodoblastus sp. TaxID=543037 RepID=UPI0025E28CF7|nr:hypothetical protein [uncultured Rhodoblastus sp.]
MIRFLRLFLLSYLYLFLVSCTKVQQYRTETADSPACKYLQDNPTALADQNNVESAIHAKSDKIEPWRCMIQSHATIRSGAIENQSSGSHPKKKNSQLSTFTLSFVEFDEQGNLIDPHNLQKAALFEHVEKSKQNLIFVFIHGWRNNADVDNRNVHSMRVLLSYSKSFVEQRCREDSRYCNANVTGVYIAWRGQELAYDDFGVLTTALATPTILSRKQASETLSKKGSYGDTLATVTLYLIPKCFDPKLTGYPSPKLQHCR